MSSFPQPPAAPDDPNGEPHVLPAWVAPPTDVLAHPVRLALVLARTDSVVVAAQLPAAYPEGFELSLSVFYRPGSSAPDPFHYRGPKGPRAAMGAVPPEILRFGLEFSDGSRCTTLDGPANAPSPGHPTITWRGGERGPERARQDFWVWPLPADGPLKLVCEWPAVGIGETATMIDAAPIRDAAKDAVSLWPDS
jgi:hypothetical protein